MIFGLLMGFTTLGQIKGTVRDEQGNPISFATVVLENTQNGTISNENGQYELTIRNNGTYTVYISFWVIKPYVRRLCIKVTSLQKISFWQRRSLCWRIS